MHDQNEFFEIANRFFQHDLPDMKKKVDDMHKTIYGGDASAIGARPLKIRVEDNVESIKRLELKFNALEAKQKVLEDKFINELPEKATQKERIDLVWKVFTGIIAVAALIWAGLK